MNSRLLLVFLPLLLWQCATPRLPEPPKLGPDDDHRLVSKEDFQASVWAALPELASWQTEPSGVSLLLRDGRTLRLEFVTPSLFRWWIPAAPGEAPLSPAAVYPALTAAVVKAVDDDIVIATPSLSVRLNPRTLSWILLRGDKVVLKSAVPRQAGRRLQQAFQAETRRWVGPGLSSEVSSAKFWTGENGTRFAAPVLVGVGAALPFAIVLDNSYQTYSNAAPEQASLGSLNGGLDLLVSAAPQSAAVSEALSALTGRPPLPPLWAHGTALVLPAAEAGTFLRRAKLAVETSVGAPASTRPLFQAASDTAGDILPDLSSPETRLSWAVDRGVPGLPAGAGIVLGPVSSRTDWNARFGETGAPLARMNNRLPQLEALAVTEAWQARNPGLRPFVLAASGSTGSIRQALPEIRLVAGNDSGALAQVLAWGASGLGTAAVRLDLTPLAAAGSRLAAYQSLLTWMLNPVFTLDWGSDPAAFWAALPDADKVRLKAILDRRSQLKELFAQAARQAALTGRPAWQPLWWCFPSDPRADRDDEFLVGDLLAAPVTGKSRQVYLPGPGVWFDYWTGEEYGGGRSYELEARADKPLLFARGGALVPTREAETFDGKDVYRALTFHVFPGGRGMGTYVLDDGRSLAWKEGSWETKVVFDFSQKDMSLEQVSTAVTGAVKPDPYVLYRIHNVFKPRQVRVDGKAVMVYGDSWGITDTDRSAAWYESDHTLLIKVFRPEKDQTVLVNF